MLSKRYILFFALILAFGFLLRAPYFLHRMQDIDEGSYAAIASAMLDGGLPYRDGVENKFPGIFYLYAAVFAAAGKYNMLAVHLFTFLWTVLTAALIGLLALRLSGRTASVLAFFFYMVFTTVLYPKMLAANSEIFMVLPYAAASLILHDALKKDSKLLIYLSGVVMACAMLLKQVGGIVLVAAVAYLLFVLPVVKKERQILRSILYSVLLCVGFATPLALVAMYFHSVGILDDWIFWTVIYAGRYISSGSETQSFLVKLLAQFGPFVASTVLLWVLAALWLRNSVRRLRESRSALDAHFSLFLLFWLLFSMLATFMGKRMFGHYFIQILPPLTLIAALEGGRLLEKASHGAKKNILAAVASFTVLPGIGFLCVAIPFEATTESWGRIDPDFTPATDYVKNHTDPEDTVFVWGWFTPLYVYAERTPSSRFVYTCIHTGYKKGDDPDEKDRSDVTWDLIPEAWDMLEKDLIEEPPEIIMDSSPGNFHAFGRYPIKDFPVLDKIVREHYVLETIVAGVGIYRHRSKGK